MLKGRPARITYKQFDKADREVKVIEAEARFHCWGIRKTKESTPKIVTTETVGICELQCGAVRLVHPEKIQFLDKAVT